MAVRIPGVGTRVSFGEVELKSDDWNDTQEYWLSSVSDSLRSSGLNLIRQLEDRVVSFSGDGGEWAEAYVDSSGRLDSVNSATAIFDEDKYKSVTNETEPFVIIEASSLTESDFKINDCNISSFEKSKWILTCEEGSDEVKRAQIYKTLFYGTDGSNPRASSTYITGISALKTSVSRDINKKAYYYSQIADTTTSSDSAEIVREFNPVETTDNNDVSSWGYIRSARKSGTSGGGEGHFDIPIGTRVINNTHGNSYGSTVIDNFGKDETEWEVDNPSDSELRAQANSNSNGSSITEARILILSNKDLNVVETTNTTSGSGSVSTNDIDFYNDNSIPAFTEATEDFYIIITHNIPSGTFPSDISNCIGVPKLEDWESGSDVKFKLLNGTEDTGWLDINAWNTFTAFTSEPTQCTIRLIPKSSSPNSGYPSINGFCVLSNKKE